MHAGVSESSDAAHDSKSAFSKTTMLRDMALLPGECQAEAVDKHTGGNDHNHD